MIVVTDRVHILFHFNTIQMKFCQHN